MDIKHLNKALKGQLIKSVEWGKGDDILFIVEKKGVVRSIQVEPRDCGLYIGNITKFNIEKAKKQVVVSSKIEGHK